MPLVSKLLGTVYGLPTRATRVQVRRDLPIPMTDGVHLLRLGTRRAGRG
ncbi:hypothetical protein SAMN05421810_101521 [Amycolatopsis arida]|uniref:Uncharacterized protein n=1 Tax=Amycolatopsis arida TaxID=587909 RepID=A0A1I5LFA4_9PSEU|nr:hypothetical protein CLV69_104154 [Amycolatopsis arida]SFO95853.1 hypothetical protein SAMN05421810_101521 [Amycolatopsis arida]